MYILRFIKERIRSFINVLIERKTQIMYKFLDICQVRPGFQIVENFVFEQYCSQF